MSLITLTFVFANTQRQTITAEPGANLMEVAVANGIDGILGNCGGYLVCGTRHVVTLEQFHSPLPARTQMERDILECAPSPQPHTRLCCQIQLEQEHEGLELHVPCEQR